MSHLKKLIVFLLLHLISTYPQINLDLTKWVSGISENNIVLQHDCLHVAATMYSDFDPQQIISYCLSESPSKWNIEEYSFDQKFTFDKLAERSITSEQLYSWSAPIDIIEDYQFYLNQLKTSKIPSMSTQLFYNCTSPTFGPLCQYSLDGYESSHLSLPDIIHDYYSYKYEPTTLTCYPHLNCSYAFGSMCLDWRNICDGQVDCSEDAIDEKYCSQLQMNKCEADEYQCKDGQCIPKMFITENDFFFDCINSRNSIEELLSLSNRIGREPTIIAEDTICAKNYWSALPILNACSSVRAPLLVESVFFNKPNSISDDCWFTFTCYFRIPNSFHPKCRDICSNDSCQNIIEKSCPDILFIPNTPILFGHILFAYTKEHAVQSPSSRLKPSYICYNDKLCGGFLPNKTLLSFNGTTCRQPQDFPVQFLQGGRGDWMDTYVSRVNQQLYHCNTVPQDMGTVCDSSTMYQCMNSSKCISKDRVGDTLQDCDYKDDEQQEVVNKVCSNDKSGKFFNCATKCINYKKFEDGTCHCDRNEYGICEDEHSLERYTTTHISFPNICDGFTELVPVNISGRYETDETECELWNCNNTYTRCDGFWNCLNGADEVDCSPTPLLDCPSQHICLSPNKKELMCLPLIKVNDGIIDCLDTLDEPKLCQSKNFILSESSFYCPGTESELCTWSRYLCDEIEECKDYIGDQFCISNRNITIAPYNCFWPDEENNSTVDKYLCNRPFKKLKKLGSRYFALDGMNQSLETIDIAKKFPPLKSGLKQRCQRGFPIRIWLNKEKNVTDITCLCPPSFYGNFCQYQNQRVRLTLKLLAYSASRRTLFTIVISLTDDSIERTIHSHQQFTYLYVRDCKIKFNIYLLYSNRPKDQTKQYSVRIDIYDKNTLTHRGSFLLPVKFLFLPIQRVFTRITIPSDDGSDKSCSNQPCIHGQCLKYSNNPKNPTFCYCKPGWSGQYCNIPHTCSCSSDSLCFGVSANNQSICVCPRNKFGSRCLLHNGICQSNLNETCYNNGECVPVDEYMTSDKKFFCICPKSFSGDRCEIFNTKITISFHENITLPQSIMVHFIQVMENSLPNNGSTFATVSIKEKSAHIYWSLPFHISFIKLENNFYLVIVQKISNTSATTFRTINPSDRCANISEVLNETIVRLHPLRRIKYYHLPCQNRAMNLSCFYDDTHFCLCTDFGHQRLANCFEFNYTNKFDCFGQGNCANGGECLQDRLICPSISVCMCPKCFYGAQCQFSSNGLGLSLDGILGYHIQPHVKLIGQPVIVQISIALTIIMSIAGLLDGILSMITFNSEDLKKVGCGLYLLSSSISTLFLTIIFALKFTILLIAQINYISNRSFLKVQCISIDFLLRVGLNMDQWLNACVAIERTVTSMKGVNFNQGKSKQMAKYVIIFLFLFITITNVYDPFYRRIIDDGDDGDQKRVWCFVTYTSGFHVLHSIVNILHFFVPFIINIVSAGLIILSTTRQHRVLHKNEAYRTALLEQMQRHRHILIAPIVLIILAIPRLIISFVSGCMKSTDDAWLFLVGYFISFIPSMLTFVVFVLPSTSYRKQFSTKIKRYRSNIRRCFCMR